VRRGSVSARISCCDGAHDVGLSICAASHRRSPNSSGSIEAAINQVVGRSLDELTVAGVQREYAHFKIESRGDGTLYELGRGAMGATYKAVDTNLHRPVALKLIAPQFVRDASVRRRFVQEARAAGSLRHPNIASVFHLGATGPTYFYAMEFVEGQTLELMIQKPWPASDPTSARNHWSGCRSTVGGSSTTDRPPRH
jgi:Protein kinase domain